MRLSSIALATAFQFDMAMRQKDVVGEWLPIEEGHTGGIVYRHIRWANGLTWADIGADMISSQGACEDRHPGRIQ